MYVHRYITLLVSEEEEGEGRERRREGKGWGKEVGRQGQAYILTILFPLCPAPQ